jgi:hypothetical protein
MPHAPLPGCVANLETALWNTWQFGVKRTNLQQKHNIFSFFFSFSINEKALPNFCSVTAVGAQVGEGR